MRLRNRRDASLRAFLGSHICEFMRWKARERKVLDIIWQHCQIPRPHILSEQDVIHPMALFEPRTFTLPKASHCDSFAADETHICRL